MSRECHMMLRNTEKKFKKKKLYMGNSHETWIFFVNVVTLFQSSINHYSELMGHKILKKKKKQNSEILSESSDSSFSSICTNMEPENPR